VERVDAPRDIFVFIPKPQMTKNAENRNSSAYGLKRRIGQLRLINQQQRALHGSKLDCVIRIDS